MKIPLRIAISSVLQLCLVFLYDIISTEGRTGEGPLLKKYAATERPGGMNQLLEVIGDVVKVHFPDCHLLMLKETDDAHADFFLRALQLRNRPFVLVDRQLMTQQTNENPSDFFLLGRKSIGCRVVVVYLPDLSNNLSVNFLQKLDISKYPEIKVLAIGLPGGERGFLMSHVFRNTIHALYFVAVSSSREGKPIEALTENHLETLEQHVDQFKNFNGYALRMAVKSFFPFAEFTRDTDQPGTSVQLVDCLEVRMLREMARKLNLTFRAFMSVDDEWGQPIGNGSWTGLVNALMKEEADFGACLFPSAKRNAVVDFTRMYAPEPFLIVTYKPQRLPQYLAIIEPFTMNMWAAIVVSFMAVGVSFWFLNKGWLEVSILRALRWAHLTDAPETFSMMYALFYTWGLLLQQTPSKYPSNSYSRIWLTCWMIFSFLIMTIYKSALFASLLVPQMSEAIDSIPQLLRQRGWTWGMEPHYSVGWQFLTESTSPDNQKIAKTLVVRPIAEEMKLVNQGKHAFFTWRNYVKSFIAAEYTDRDGYTPMYISRQYYLETSGAYWGTRKGAPFLRTIIDIKQRLFEGRILDLWLNQIFRETTKRARDKNVLSSYIQDDGNQVVLNLNHLQGAFYVFFIGMLLAVLVLMSECLRKLCWSGN